MGEAKRRKESDPRFGRGPMSEADRLSLLETLPPGTTPEDYFKYLECNWDTMAAFAYESYVNQGRGLLIVDWDLTMDACVEFLTPELKQLRGNNCPMFYVGERNGLFSLFHNQSDFAQWNEIVQKYDPEIMIILALSWNFHPEQGSRMMARSVAMVGRKSPIQLYVENGDRLQEFTFWSGTNQSVKPHGNQMVRSFQAEILGNPEFGGKVRRAFDEGWQKRGRGAVLAIPRGSDYFEAIYVPKSQFAEALGDEGSRAFDQLLSIADLCNPDIQVTVIVIDSDLKSDTFGYFPFLFHLPRKAPTS